MIPSCHVYSDYIEKDYPEYRKYDCEDIRHLAVKAKESASFTASLQPLPARAVAKDAASTLESQKARDV